VNDDERGADKNRYQLKAAGHFGLTMMQDRTRRLGGTFSVKGAPEAGTVVMAATILWAHTSMTKSWLA
jgi:signal transduction histidine kinase